MNIARIKNGIVVNIESADLAWLNSERKPADIGFLFIPFPTHAPAHVGLKWSEAEGFEQPPVEKLPAGFLAWNETPPAPVLDLGTKA